jgi:hypothetical protein
MLRRFAITALLGTGVVLVLAGLVACSVGYSLCAGTSHECMGIPEAAGWSPAWQLVAALLAVAGALLVALALLVRRHRLSRRQVQLALIAVLILSPLTAYWAHDRSNVYYESHAPYRQGDREPVVGLALLIPAALAVAALAGMRRRDATIS